MNNAEIVADFRRRWEGTYAWLYMDKLREETMVNIQRVEDNNDKVATITVTSQKYGQLVLNLGSDEHELRFKYPPVGVFQSGKDAYLFRRRPARQYRRGICPDNSLLWNVTRHVVGNRARFTSQEVLDAFVAKTYTNEEALSLLSKDYKGVALSSNYAITLSLDAEPDYVLWHWDNPVARIDTKTGKISSWYEKSYQQTLAEKFK